MSWFFKSLEINDPDSSDQIHSPTPEHTPTTNHSGVKDDLSVLGDTIGRQLRGVAAFLAPPPPPPPPSIITTEEKAEPSDSSSSSSSSQTLLGIRNDLAEIGGSFKSGLSLLSSNKSKAVSEISKFASNLLQFQNDDEVEEDDYDYDYDYAYDYDYDNDNDNDDVPGITEEVIDFVNKISLRPEWWTDFPLSLDYDFKMSDAQREHALAIERLAPSLAALKANLCSYMEDEQFWIIYFILLLPRLNEHDFELLSTPKIVETRDVLLQKLQNKRNAQINTENSCTPDTSQEGSKVNETQGDNISSGEKETQGENISSKEKEATETISAAEGLTIDDEENTEQWLEEADIDTGASMDAQKRLEHEEDVSFSDLEDDDNDLSRRLSASRPTQNGRASSPNGSNDWVQLNESSETQEGLQKAGQSTSRDKDSEGEDWLTVDEFD